MKIYSENFRSGPSPSIRKPCPATIDGSDYLGRNALSSFTSNFASSSESLTPFSITYPKVMRRAFRRARIIAAGLQQFRNRIFAIERHQFVAQFVAHRMQRDRQHDAHFVAGADDVRHHARVDSVMRRREMPMPSLSDAINSASRTASKLYSGSPHPHHHHVGDEAAAGRGLAVGPVVETVARPPSLADDLAGGEIAHQPLGAGVAEREFSVQPTCEETHSVPRSVSGI